MSIDQTEKNTTKQHFYKLKFYDVKRKTKTMTY